MRKFTRTTMLRISRALAIVIYVVVADVSGRASVGTICSTEDCKLTEDDFAAFMKPTKSPCQNFFKYACGKANDFLDSVESTSQYDFLAKNLLDGLMPGPISDPVEPDDGQIIKWAKHQFQVGENTSTEEKLDAVVKFLNDLPMDGSWWDLETFLVREGLPSSLFRVSRRESNESAIVIRPLVYDDTDNLPFEEVSQVLEMVKQHGLSTKLLVTILSCSEKNWAEGSYPNTYAESQPVSLYEWPDLWIQYQEESSELSREDWNAYFNSFWPGKSEGVDWVNMLNITLERPDVVSKLGKIWVDNKLNLKYIIACGTFRHLMKMTGLPRHYKTCEPSEINKYRLMDMDRELYPEPLKMGVKDLANKITMQAKLQSFQAIINEDTNNYFIGRNKINMYNHLVELARYEREKLRKFVLTSECCNNYNLTDFDKAVKRVTRFERRYPHSVSDYWTPTYVTNEASELSIKLKNPIGLSTGMEREYYYPTLQFKVPDKSTSFMDEIVQGLRFITEQNLNSFESFDDIVHSTTAAGHQHVKFRVERPSALNYGGLGTIIAAHYMTENATEPLQFEDMKSTLNITWNAYLFDKKSGPKDYGRLSTLPKLNDDALFFLAFANTQCDSDDGNILNKVLAKNLPFKRAYGCLRKPRRHTTRAPQAED